MSGVALPLWLGFGKANVQTENSSGNIKSLVLVPADGKTKRGGVGEQTGTPESFSQVGRLYRFL